MIPQLETGGAERTTIDIGCALVTEGWTSLVASQGGRMVEQLQRQGSIHITLPVATKNPLTMFINAFRLMRLIKTHHVTIIHARSRAPAWSALMATKLTGIPFVTTYHGAYRQKIWLKGLYNSIMVRSNVVIANSNWTADLVRSRHRNVDARLHVIHRGTDFADFDPTKISKSQKQQLRQQWGIAADRRIVLNLARLTAWKGQLSLIDSVPAVLKQHPEVVFVLAGDDQGRASYRKRIENRISELAIGKYVRLPGHCDVPATACAVADLAIIASNRPEAFGRTAVEAQAMGVAVVVTNIGATGETVLSPPQVTDNKRTGWRVAPDNVEAMTRAICASLALNNKEKKLIANNARAHVLKRFSVAQMTSKTLAVYDKLSGR